MGNCPGVRQALHGGLPGGGDHGPAVTVGTAPGLRHRRDRRVAEGDALEQAQPGQAECGGAARRKCGM